MEYNEYPTSYSWQKKSPSSSQFEALPPEVNKNVAYFQIPRVELKHAGIYILSVYNSKGHKYGSYEFELQVKGRAEIFLQWSEAHWDRWFVISHLPKTLALLHAPPWQTLVVPIVNDEAKKTSSERRLAAWTHIEHFYAHCVHVHLCIGYSMM